VSSGRLSEVTILVRDLEAAAAAWANASGFEAEIASGEGRFRANDVLVRLIAPKEGDHVAGLLEQRGEGMFDFAIEVDDLQGLVAQLGAQGVAVGDIMEGEDGRGCAVIDPASTFGVPIRLVEKQ
jgi:hypothetical protein